MRDEESKAMLRAILERLDVQSARMESIEMSFNKMQGNMKEMQGNMNQMQENMNQMQENMNQMQADIKRIADTQERQEKVLERLSVRSLEQEADIAILRRLSIQPNN